MPSKPQGKILSPIPLRPGPSTVKNWYREQSIKWQLKWDEHREGPLIRANVHNKNTTRLLSLPNKIRYMIWEYAIMPSYYVDYRESVDILSRDLEIY
jgi:hypothetical protein